MWSSSPNSSMTHMWTCTASASPPNFRTSLLPGAKRLFELADELAAVHVEVLCWCGRPGQLNARVVGGRVVREGDTVVVADTLAEPDGAPTPVHYQVLCRAHHRRGDLGPAADSGQLALDV
jgi:thymidine kinase